MFLLQTSSKDLSETKVDILEKEVEKTQEEQEQTRSEKDAEVEAKWTDEVIKEMESLEEKLNLSVVETENERRSADLLLALGWPDRRELAAAEGRLSAAVPIWVGLGRQKGSCAAIWVSRKVGVSGCAVRENEISRNEEVLDVKVFVDRAGEGFV